jgi:hypothetical protein
MLWPPWLPERPRMNNHPKAIIPTIIRGQASAIRTNGIPHAQSITSSSFPGP